MMGNNPAIITRGERNSFAADEAMQIHEYITGEHAKHTSLVIGELDGFHGTFLNHQSEKVYYVISGAATFTVDGETYELNAGDTLLIPPKTRHAMDGEATFVIVTSPPYDPEHEEVLEDE